MQAADGSQPARMGKEKRCCQVAQLRHARCEDTPFEAGSVPASRSRSRSVPVPVPVPVPVDPTGRGGGGGYWWLSVPARHCTAHRAAPHGTARHGTATAWQRGASATSPLQHVRRSAVPAATRRARVSRGRGRKLILCDCLDKVGLWH